MCVVCVCVVCVCVVSLCVYVDLRSSYSLARGWRWLSSWSRLAGHFFPFFLFFEAGDSNATHPPFTLLSLTLPFTFVFAAAQFGEGLATAQQLVTSFHLV